MAYYEMMPAGLPAGLQAGMDSVLNKKFGQSTTYPPADWPDTVNLMGPLPIIISNKAPIVSFNDGADDVPVESGTFYIVPSQAGTGTPSPSNPRVISGYTGMTITHAKKNLFDKDNANVIDGYIDVSSFNTNNVRAKTIYIPIKGGVTYTVSKTVGARFSIATSSNIPSNGATYTSRQAGNTSPSLTITADANDTYLWAWVYLENTDTGTLADMLASVQIEVGSTATIYEPYATPETLAVSWQTEAGTVYGGELNVTTGVLTATYASETYNGDEAWSAYASGNGYARTVTGMASGTYYNDAKVVCDIFAKQPDNSNLGVRVGVANSNIYVVQANTLDGVSDATTFRTWLSTHNMTFTYKLATPQTYQLTPHELRTFLGANNFYCDTGDSQLNYRADINLALAGA